MQRFILGSILLCACGPRSREAVRVVNVAPTVEADETPDRVTLPVGPWHEHRSAWDVDALLRAPEIAWQARLGGPVVHPLRTDGDRVYVVAAGQLTALSTSGDMSWSVRIQASGPAGLRDSEVLVGTEEGPITAYDRERGSLVRQHPGFGPVRGAPVPVQGGDHAWVTLHGMVGGASGWLIEAGYSSAGGGSSDGQQLYFSTLEGQLLAIAREGQAWTAVLPGPGLGHPVLDETTVFAAYATVMGRPGGVAAYDRASGEERWRWRGTFEPGAPPALGRYLLLPDRDGTLTALDPNTGDTVWVADARAELSCTPVVLGSSVLVGTATGEVVRYDLDDGGEIWRVNLAAAVTGDPVLLDDQLVVGLADGRVVALRSDD